MSRAFTRISINVLCLAAALGASRARPAGAQQSDPEARPTRGVHIPGSARAGDADAGAVQLNPAQLALLPAFDLALTAGFGAKHDFEPLPGRGVGIFYGTPTFWGGALGLGLSYAGSAPGVGLDAHTTFQLAYAQRLGRHAALGVTWAHIWDSTFAGTDTFDLGLSYRLARYVALGLVVEDVGQPRPGGPTVAPRLPRLWAGDLVIRPLATDQLEVLAGAAHANGDAWERLVPRGRITGRLAEGLRLYVEALAVPRGTELAFASGADYRFSFGLAVDTLGHTGAILEGRAADPGAGEGSFIGAALVRVEGQRRPTVAEPVKAVRVSLDGVDDERAYLTVVRRLRAVAADPKVAAVVLKVENMQLGLGRIEELRDLVAALRARGKRVFAYAPFPSTRDYYLATACDAIVVHPAGELSLTGFSQTVTFYKGTMDRLGVNVDLVRIGEFKGAMEPFIMTEQSAPVRQNKNELLDDVFRRLVAAISAARKRGGRVLDEARVRMLIDRGIFTPFEAQLLGLVDAVKDEGELDAYVGQMVGRPGIALRDVDAAPTHPLSWPSRRVAVVLVDGAIVDGPSHKLPFDLGTFAGSDTLLGALEECRRDPSVAAVVLRVNSPGGSAFASDVVARAIRKLRQAGKPVLASMGDMAASGGYYISAPADLIFAEPSTVSGSIGIFGYKVDVRRLMSRVGISAETYRRGQHADYFSPYRAWTDEEIKMTAEKIRHFYGLFLNTVAEGRRSRGLTLARVDEIGRGHVWTGAQAQGLGLVDRLGGVGAAIEEAAAMARVPLGRDEQPDLLVLPRPTRGVLERLAGLSSEGDQETGGIGLRGLGAAGGAAVRLLGPLLVGGGSGIEARIPYDLEIR